MNWRHALSVALALMSAPMATGSIPEATRLNGVWAPSVLPEEHASWEAAVGRLCDQLNPLLRLFGCAQIRERNHPYAHVRLLVDEQGGFEHFSYGQWTVAAPLSGEKTRSTNEHGELVVVSARVHQGRLWHSLRTDLGLRTDTLTASLDGTTLVIESTVESLFFPSPLRYRFSYRRITNAATALEDALPQGDNGVPLDVRGTTGRGDCSGGPVDAGVRFDAGWPQVP